MTKETKPVRKPATKITPAKSKPEIVRHDDGTIELNITVSENTIKEARKKVENHLVAGISIPGFRKGKAPRDAALKRIPEEKIREEILQIVITDEYKKTVEKHDLKPILTPQIHIEEFKDDEDLLFTAEVAEEPEVKLGDYKKSIKELTGKSKIIVDKNKEPQKPSIDAVIQAGLNTSKVKISKVIIDREVSRLLSQLIDEIRQIGMTLEQYLESRKITAEQLREDYVNRAKRDIELEFFLRKVADEEKITVSADDIAASIAKIEDKTQQDELKKNPYLVATIIRQQKTIDFLTQI